MVNQLVFLMIVKGYWKKKHLVIVKLVVIVQLFLFQLVLFVIEHLVQSFDFHFEHNYLLKIDLKHVVLKLMNQKNLLLLLNQNL